MNITRKLRNLPWIKILRTTETIFNFITFGVIIGAMIVGTLLFLQSVLPTWLYYLIFFPAVAAIPMRSWRRYLKRKRKEQRAREIQEIIEETPGISKDGDSYLYNHQSK